MFIIQDVNNEKRVVARYGNALKNEADTKLVELNALAVGTSSSFELVEMENENGR